MDQKKKNRQVKEQLRQALKEFCPARYILRVLEPSTELMEERLFISTIDLLQKCELQSRDAQDLIGIDLTYYEEGLYQVIENLFLMHFSRLEVELIQNFIYDMPELKEAGGWDGTLEITTNEGASRLEFNTPQDLWKALKFIKKATK